jgi:hypothetical protein
VNGPHEYTPLEFDEEALAMLGKQSGQDGGDHAYLDHVGRGSFYGFLASLGEELFRDEDFADLYYPANGRPSPRVCWRRPCLPIMRLSSRRTVPLSSTSTRLVR